MKLTYPPNWIFNKHFNIKKTFPFSQGKVFIFISLRKTIRKTIDFFLFVRYNDLCCSCYGLCVARIINAEIVEWSIAGVSCKERSDGIASLPSVKPFGWKNKIEYIRRNIEAVITRRSWKPFGWKPTGVRIPLPAPKIREWIFPFLVFFYTEF